MTTRLGFVSTYPPTQCGLATFTSSLRGALVAESDLHGPVVRVVEAPESRPADEVVAHLVRADPASLARAADQLNACDVAIVQHEYGIYGGDDGDEVEALLDRVEVPSIVVLHTVLSEPTTHQREVLESVVDKADAVVVMSRTAWDRLLAGYRVDAAKVSVVPHGAHESAHSTLDVTFRTSRFTILTWGLIGPGKGIEWGIEAMGLLRDVRPTPHYVIAGQTHPKVMLREGESYRESLVARIRRLSLQTSVSFDPRYRPAAELAQLVAAADVVLLPYDSSEQVTSGVLIEAVAAGKPVVATRFPHAVELLADGAGLVVPHADPVAIAGALRAVITNRDLATSLSTAATTAAPHLRWSAIAVRYRELAEQLISARVAA